MSIPSGDKALGQDGHVGDHNDITDALRDHEERLSAVEGTEASDVPDTRSISTTAPLLGGGDLSADRTLSLALGTGLVESGGSLSPDFGTGSGKVAEGDDSRFTDARTPTAHASTHTDGGSDEIAVTLSQISQSGATTGQVPKWDGSAWSPGDEAGGGGGGGGLVLIDSGTFSASSGFNVDSVFDGTYDNYRLVIAPLDHSTHGTLRMQLRAGGSTISGANYDTQYLYAYASSAAPGTDDGSTSFNIATLSSDGVISFDIFQPAVARKTVMTGLRFSYQGDASDFVLTMNGWVHHLTTAYDGFRLFPNSGTFTGSWALYGYAKAA